MNDVDQLAGRLAKDLHATFPEFVSTYEDAIFSIALRSLSSRDLAYEIAADAFDNAYRALLNYEPERITSIQLRPWLVTIVLNACRNAKRSAKRTAGVLSVEEISEIESHGETTERAAERRDEQVRLERALAMLPEQQRKAVVLRYIADCSYEEIAIALGRPLGTARSDVSRGLARLRRLLERTN